MLGNEGVGFTFLASLSVNYAVVWITASAHKEFHSGLTCHSAEKYHKVIHS